MIHLVNYSDEKMTIAQDLCSLSARKNGVDHVHQYREYSIRNSEFYMNNKSTLEHDRAGFWLWKSWCVNEVMRGMNDGDILLYSDSGIEFIAPVSEIIERMDEEIFFFTNTFKQVEWTKGIIMDTILPQWRDGRYDNAMQVQASSLFIKVCQKTRDFVKEWMLYCQMPGLIDDSPSPTPNFPTFAENRHDQSVICALQIKYGYKLHWFPTTTAHHIRDKTPNDNYPVMFFHHRKRNNEWA